MPTRLPRAPFNLAVVAVARQRRRTLGGLLLILGLAAGALLVFFMDPLLSTLRDDAELIALFESAPDVAPGAQVWIAGRPQGTVRSVEFLPLTEPSQPRLVLVLSVSRSGLRHVRQDASVQLTSERMVGDPVVDILPGSPGASPIEPGDTLRAAVKLSSAEVVARAAALRAAVDSLLGAAAPVNERARDRMAALARVQAGFAGSQRELARLSASLAASPMMNLTSDPAVERALSRLRAASAELRTSSGAGADPAVARVQAAFAPLTRHAGELSARLDSLRMLAAPNGTLTRMQNDSALAVAIRGAQAQLDSLIAEARANPARFVF